MRTGLENLIRRVASGVAVLGLAASLTGCAMKEHREISPGEGEILLGQVITENARNKGDALLGKVITTLGELQYQKELANEGRTEVNINQPQEPQQQPQQQREVPQNVVCKDGICAPVSGYTWVKPEDPKDLEVEKIIGSLLSYRWVDYNQSRNVDVENELVERRNRFKRGESAAIVVKYESEKPAHQNLKLYGPSGRVIYENDVNPYIQENAVKVYDSKGNETHSIVEMSKYHEGGYQYPGIGQTIGLDKEYIERLLEEYGEGQYSMVWRTDGEIEGSVTVDLIY